MKGRDPRSVAADAAGNIVVAGDTSLGGEFGDAVVAKFSPEGELVWSNTYGKGGPQFATDVAVDGDNNVLLVGSFGGESRLRRPKTSILAAACSTRTAATTSLSRSSARRASTYGALDSATTRLRWPPGSLRTLQAT